MATSKEPGWRPQFRFYHAWLSAATGLSNGRMCLWLVLLCLKKTLRLFWRFLCGWTGGFWCENSGFSCCSKRLTLPGAFCIAAMFILSVPYALIALGIGLTAIYWTARTRPEQASCTRVFCQPLALETAPDRCNNALFCRGLCSEPAQADAGGQVAHSDAERQHQSRAVLSTASAVLHWQSGRAPRVGAVLRAAGERNGVETGGNECVGTIRTVW